jgi:Na+-transporting methylmalonyl-CoA/oxaloacetate decarboxylase gamma subunit
MLGEGLIIMLIGMGAVFLFLAALVIIMYGFRFFIRFLPIENRSPSLETARGRDATPEEIAAAVAAIKKFKNK